MVIILLGFIPSFAHYRQTIELPEGIRAVFSGDQDAEFDLSRLEAYLKELAHNKPMEMKAVKVVLNYLQRNFGNSLRLIDLEAVYQRYAKKWVGKCFGARKKREKRERKRGRGIVQITSADVTLMVAALKRRMTELEQSLAGLKVLLSSDLNDDLQKQAAIRIARRQIFNAKPIADQITRFSYLSSTTNVCDRVCDEYKALLAEIDEIQAALYPVCAVKSAVKAPTPSKVRSFMFLDFLRHAVVLHLIDDLHVQVVDAEELVCAHATEPERADTKEPANVRLESVSDDGQETKAAASKASEAKNVVM